VSGFTIPEIEPRLFSFNNPFGACPACDGLGSQRAIDASLIVPDDNLSCATAPSRPGRSRPRPITRRRWKAWAKSTASSPATSSRISPEAQYAILHGTGNDEIAFQYDDGLRSYKTTKTFEGVIPNLERRWKETDPPGCARRSSASCRPLPAPLATAIA
jgi:excinuclease ABC subunit A